MKGRRYSYLLRWPRRAGLILAVVWAVEAVAFVLLQPITPFWPRHPQNYTYFTGMLVILALAPAMAWIFCDGDRVGRKNSDRLLLAMATVIGAIAVPFATFVMMFAGLLVLVELVPASTRHSIDRSGGLRLRMVGDHDRRWRHRGPPVRCLSRPADPPDGTLRLWHGLPAAGAAALQTLAVCIYSWVQTPYCPMARES